MCVLALLSVAADRTVRGGPKEGSIFFGLLNEKQSQTDQLHIGTLEPKISHSSPQE